MFLHLLTWLLYHEISIYATTNTQKETKKTILYCTITKELQKEVWADAMPFAPARSIEFPVIYLYNSQ